MKPLAPKNTVPARGFPRARGRGTPKGRATVARGLLRDSHPKSNWRNGVKAGGTIRLPTAFGYIKSEFFGAARETIFDNKDTTIQGRHEVFQDIGKRTGTFLKSPSYDDRIIEVWGEPHQITAAEEQIKALLAQCPSLNKPKKRDEPKKRDDWTKVRAFSTKKETNFENKERGDEVLQQLRKEPESGYFPAQLLFLWPNDGPPHTKCLGPQLEDLDEIRYTFGCHLFIPKDMPGYICAVGHDNDHMKQIAQRVRTLLAELVAKTVMKGKIYLIEPLQPSKMKDQIVVERGQVNRPVLQGAQLEGHDLERWQVLAGLIQSKNRNRLLVAVENCLKGISFVRGHLRMRVNLGAFVLDNYKKPEEGEVFGFEDFREMLLHEQTKARLIPGLKVGQSELLERCFKATHLLEPCDSTSTSLKDAELAYSVNFEFIGTDKSMLRLEVEFTKCPGAREYEVKERRWLKPRISGQTGEKEPPLHVAVIDFERSDWQLEIKSLEFYETSSINAALKSFSHSIGFRSTETAGNMAAKPEQKVTFPADAPVFRFVEKSAIRYRLKGTEYILEIARYDEYRRPNVQISPSQASLAGVTVPGVISPVPYTSWGASVIGTNWDNLLGDHANLPVGHSAKYTPSLATFFQAKESSSGPEGDSGGFWEFIDLVKQAADLLGPAKTSPSNAVVEAAFNTESSPLKAGSSESEATAPAIPAPADAADSAGVLDADLGTLF
ncbi:hypothetical protein BJX99DRAFT_267127 [Aspergillus californicus]